MKFFKCLCFALICFGVIAPASFVSAKPTGKPKVESSFLIVPGVRVGPVRLGMTRRQVKAVLGAPKYVYYGHKEYGGPARESYPNYHVAFNSDQANGRVIIIEVKSPRFKMANGLSTGSQLKTIQSRYSRMTVVKDHVQDMYAFSYNNRSEGIGFCFDGILLTDDPIKNRNATPKADQRPVAIGVYKRNGNWKGFYSSE